MSEPDERDWRLSFEFDLAETRHSLHDLVGRFREPNVVNDVKACVAPDVVITHDGKLMFAYAIAEATVRNARDAIEATLQRDNIKAVVRMSCWDDKRGVWRQTDPPPTESEKRLEDAAERDAETVETRTIVVTSGKLIRDELERSMLDWANELGVECRTIEHPHLLTTQVGFVVTGPKHMLDEFSQGLNAEEHATIRTETSVMLSPL